MSTNSRRFLCALVLSIAPACTSTRSELVRVEAPGMRIRAAGGSTLELPVGWVYQLSPQGLVTARENPFLHLMTFGYAEPAGPDDKANDPRQTPAELAENVVALAKSAGGWSHVEVLANEPVTLGGRPGCRVHLRMASPEQRQPVREAVLCAAIQGKGVYRLSYVAWAGEHFTRDLPLYEAVLASVRLPETPAP